MHVKTLLLPQELRVMIQSSIESPGPDVVYLIPQGCPDYHKFSTWPITRDQIRSIHSRALSKASNITVMYPKLRQIQVQVHNHQQEITHGSV